MSRNLNSYTSVLGYTSISTTLNRVFRRMYLFYTRGMQNVTVSDLLYRKANVSIWNCNEIVTNNITV